MAAAERAPFEVLDALGGVTELVRASPTLDGSIPLRAAQACSPLLDGNRFGFQLALRQRLELEKTLTGIKLASIPAALARSMSGAVPRLFAEGLLDATGRWPARLGRGLVARERTVAGRTRVSLFSGLLVRARPGIWLRLGHAGNRRNLAFDVEERWVVDDGRFAPLIVTLCFEPGTRFPLTLLGEIATLAPLVPNVRVQRAALADAPELGRAHMSFFDQKYFDKKKNGPTRKYRRLVNRLGAAETEDSAALTVVDAGPRCVGVATPRSFLTFAGVESRAPVDGHVETLVFENAVSLSARFDGHNTLVAPDESALERFAAETSRVWSNAFDAELLQQHRGSLWYFTKYVTPHQPGEPYFFVKPPALVQTPPGWSVLIDGIAGPGYTVLRGVVAADVFFAAPAVIRVDQPGRNLKVPRGQPLANIVAFPRWLSSAEPEIVQWSYAPKRSAGA